jgi:hypothetical protein
VDIPAHTRWPMGTLGGPAGVSQLTLRISTRSPAWPGYTVPSTKRRAQKRAASGSLGKKGVAKRAAAKKGPGKVAVARTNTVRKGRAKGSIRRRALPKRRSTAGRTVTTASGRKLASRKIAKRKRSATKRAKRSAAGTTKTATRAQARPRAGLAGADEADASSRVARLPLRHALKCAVLRSSTWRMFDPSSSPSSDCCATKLRIAETSRHFDHCRQRRPDVTLQEVVPSVQTRSLLGHGDAPVLSEVVRQGARPAIPVTLAAAPYRASGLVLWPICDLRDRKPLVCSRG